jgi:diguanylate cyclase (GGDEF)-like protein/PAS domain S-box-containing protein
LYDPEDRPVSHPLQKDTLKLRVFLTTIVTAVIVAVGAAQWTLHASEQAGAAIRAQSAANAPVDISAAVATNDTAPSTAATVVRSGDAFTHARSVASLGAILIGLAAGIAVGIGAWRLVRPLRANSAGLALRVRAMLDYAEVGIALTRHGRFEMVSSRLLRMLRAQREDELVDHATSAIHVDDASYKAFSERAHPAFMAQGTFEGEVELMRLDGTTFWARMIGRALEPGDRAQGTIWVFEDVTETRKKREELTWAANHDGLTGLINRVAFERLLDGSIAIAGTAPFCALFIDLDYFKQVNDTAGHAAGDALLKGLASSFRSCLRRADTVARLGGDEFGVILPGCPPAKARELADMLRKAVKDYRLRWEGREYAVGASIGLVIADGRHGSTAHMMKEADAACYEAKRGGRNRVSVAPEPRTPVTTDAAADAAVEETQPS